MRNSFFLGLVLFFLFYVITASSFAATRPDEIPPALTPWKSWVLHGHNEAFCPKNYNDGTAATCRWPTRLKLDVKATEGKFEASWLIFAEGWVPLPGSMEIWPENVTVDGKSIAVILHEQSPAVRLDPGEHRIMGRFDWKKMPEVIPVPVELGLIALTINQKEIKRPIIDNQGRVWLQRRETKESREDALKVQVFRLLDDLVPMQVTTLLKLDVSGKSREIDLEGGLLAGSVPMAVDSRLPTRITPEGKIIVQARPGSWEIRILARLKGPQTKIDAGKCIHGNEIWSFKPHHDLRMVEIGDMPAIEPSQTEMPSQWRGFQAFLARADTVMTLKELRRGDPDPAPDQLSLRRTFWMDFDGGGATVHDRISGTLSRNWHLAVNPPMVLGRVSIDGQDQVITEQGKQKKMGVELRRGQLNLEADGRLPNLAGENPAVGWDHDFNSVSAIVHLPPGWRLLTATGADGVSDSWLQRWSLLDFFLVLIIALSLYKLRSYGWGLIAFFTMVLIFHEPGAPRTIWLHILAVLALVPLLPDGWFKRMVKLWGLGAVIVLLVIAIPFVIHQLRWGIYPQLAPHWSVGSRNQSVDNIQATMEEEAPEMDSLASPKMQPPLPLLEKAAKRKSIPSKSRAYERSSSPAATGEEFLLRQQDPDAAIPTGPGLPDWRWQSINLNWSGSVVKAQTLRLYLLSPRLNLLLALVRVGLLVLLIWGLIDRNRMIKQFHPKKNITAIILLAAIFCPLWQSNAAAAESGFPPQSLLDELSRRLLEKPDCLPFCADMARMELTVKENRLQIMLQVSSAAMTAIPLPANRKSWVPDQIMLDYAPIDGLTRDARGQLWALVPEGVHNLVLTGDNLTEDLLQIPLPLKPHRIDYSAKGWKVEGIHDNGSVDSSIQLTRLHADMQSDIPATMSGADGLTPFLNVERVLDLGLTWRATTTVTRLTPLGTPVVVNLPLLANESVTTTGISVSNGYAQINLAPDQRSLTYTAGLKVVPEIELMAPQSVPWTETWRLAVSPIWHCELKGIAPIHHQDTAGAWQPRWQPWPGEEVSISISRPTAAAAQTKTIDQAGLTFTAGNRSCKGELNLSLRTSRGGQHAIDLPSGADLQKVTVNGRTLPVKQEQNRVTIPLQPGTQKIGVTWQLTTPFKALLKVPAVNIGHKAVNADVTLKLPDQRWVLFAGGPRWGPAVLFWSYLLAVVLAAVALGQITIVPISTWQWLLLGLGLTQIHPITALVIVGWLIALGAREQREMPRSNLAYNTLQIGLAIWTLIALIALFTAVKAGLIGMPEMQIEGNNSSYRVLHWSQDHIGKTLPQPWVFTLSVWIYRGLMLAWSLWLAMALLKWLAWGWQSIRKGDIWRKIVFRWPRKPLKTTMTGDDSSAPPT